jgi:FkbM family methyltransferase
VAISETEGEAEFLAISGPTSMLSGLVKSYDPRHVNRINKEATELGAEKTVLRVPTRRLDSLFREHGLTRIHYLSIDVEGAEFECLRSIDFNAVYIDVIGFETNYMDTLPPMLEFLKERGYTQLPFPNGECFMIRSGSPFTSQTRSVVRLR